MPYGTATLGGRGLVRTQGIYSEAQGRPLTRGQTQRTPVAEDPERVPRLQDEENLNPNGADRELLGHAVIWENGYSAVARRGRDDFGRDFTSRYELSSK